MKILGPSVISLALFLTACEDPAANKPKAQTANISTANSVANSAANATVATAAGETLAVTPDNSKVLFTASKVTGKHDGGFKTFEGTIELNGGKPQDSKVTVNIDTRSVFTDTPDLTKHLITADFFDVEKFPKATFTSTKIEPDAAKGADNYVVSGELELHGQKKAIMFPATIKVVNEDVSMNAEFSIDRKEFGILYAGKADDLIRDDVVINLELRTSRKK